jgi:hypothetical protein
MIGLGIMIPALGVILNPNFSNSYPLLVPIIKFIGNPNQKTLIFYGMF